MKTDHKSPFCLMAVDFYSELSCTAKKVLACEKQYFFELYYETSGSTPKFCRFRALLLIIEQYVDWYPNPDNVDQFDQGS